MLGHAVMTAQVAAVGYSEPEVIDGATVIVGKQVEKRLFFWYNRCKGRYSSCLWMHSSCRDSNRTVADVLYLLTMSNLSIDGLNDKWLRLVGIPISVLMATLLQMPVYYPGRWDLWWKFTALAFVFTVLIWEVGRVMLLTARRRWPRLEDTYWRLGISFLGWVALVSVFHLVLLGLIDWLGFCPFKTLTWLGFRNNFLTSLFFWTILGSAYEAIYFFTQYKNVLQKTEQLQMQHARQQLDALKNRVNPHFLFNALTTLSALIGEDRKTAEKFVDELSTVYRYLLRAGRQKTSSLEEEFQFVESYAFLLQNRFNNGAFSLAIDSKQTDAAAWRLPVLSLQNAVDYLVRTQNIPLHIRLKPTDNQLFVSCSHRPKTLSFDLPGNDWQHLESHGAGKQVHSDALEIRIPLTLNADHS